ncbi:sugar ABC transporter substrate-binding protein [Testudinibacter sp. TR-2022]|uniref:substrate-binding domain-containing protein n=1 Tax=Testudinibacter sp. TR-2022 TaxID=2585029 RepID=UPI001117C866|nr:substrate-binding domain-containing protein [Testudinibacter sp. TR-2022]TNH01245.1 sugar ABC transporter substrate-binding protein [Pasteurellaceae bacterium Phil31]TNH05898.1 sugar ABC transporter substrate-binding protein [Testudinibacter sp. TR-2022]TNH06565.1 sugar ABC transporter substrate-binding protein [Testudinibacter sp. TR-2022]TNH14013.1 sugar ABC transporter substrate-binding protein [Testudinibacter sp. TR-2022]TNH15359.1 sugar ABC transporter substrate-binding protein [Testu
MKKWLLTSVALAVSTTAIAQKSPVKISILMYGMKAEFVQLMEKSAKDHPAVKQGLATLTIYDGRYDPLVQNNQAETAIQTKTDAIIINPMDYEANIDVVTMANKANIPVVVTNARLNTDKMTSEVVSDDVEGGYLEAKAVLEKMNCKGNVVIIEGPKGGSGEIQRGQGNERAIAECGEGNITILERKTANWSRSEAIPLMENWLQKHRGKINGVIAQNDEMALGAIEAIQSAGLNVYDFAIAGVDGVSDAIHAVKEKKMTSILQDARGQIHGSIDVVMKAVVGDSYQPMSDIWQQYQGKMDWNDGKSKRYDVPWTVVTLENADHLLDMRK